jgi:hypothetical protein
LEILKIQKTPDQNKLGSIKSKREPPPKKRKMLGPKFTFEIRNCTTLVYTFTLGLEFFKTYIR